MLDAILHLDWQLLWLCCVPLFMFPNCPCCAATCIACLDADYPTFITLTITGTTGTCAGTGACSQYDGSYDIDLSDDCSSDGTTHGATYSELFLPGEVNCDASGLAITILIAWTPGTGTRSITITMDAGAGSEIAAQYLLSQASQANPFDCNPFGALSIPRTSTTGTCTMPATVSLT